MDYLFDRLARDPKRALQYVPTRELVQKPQAAFAIWWELERMERDRLLVSKRVPGQGDYWRVSMLSGAVYRVLCEKWRRRRDWVPTADIAAELNKNHRVIQRELAKLEAAGVIERRLSRGGWLPVVRSGNPSMVIYQ